MKDLINEICQKMNYDKHFKHRLKKILNRLKDGEVAFDDKLIEHIEKIRKLGKDSSSQKSFQLRFGNKWESEWNKKTDKCRITTEKMTIKYGKQKAKDIAKSKCSGNIDVYIKKYGEQEGKVRWNNYCEKRKSTYAVNKKNGKYSGKGTLEYFVERHGPTKGAQMHNDAVERLLKNQSTRSKPANRLFDAIKKEIPEIQYHPNEKILDKVTTNKYKADCFYNDRVIEFNGDYFHANPTIYNEDMQIRKFSGYKTAKEIWKQDEVRITKIQDHYNVLIIWEQDFVRKPKETIDKCIQFLKMK